MLISLSHPGYQFKQSIKTNEKAQEKIIHDDDIIIDNHLHALSDYSITYGYKKIDGIIINQAGGDGLVLVRQEFEFTKFSGKKLVKSHTISVSQKTEG